MIISFEEGEGDMIMTVTEELRQEDRHSIQVESIGRMLKAGLPVEDIAKYSGMTVKEVEEVVASA